MRFPDTDERIAVDDCSPALMKELWWVMGSPGADDGARAEFCVQFSQQIFMHPYHQPQDHQQIEGQKRGADVVDDQAEYRRHQAAAHISGGHLYADHGLGPVCAKMLRRGVNEWTDKWGRSQGRSGSDPAGKPVRPEAKTYKECRRAMPHCPRRIIWVSLNLRVRNPLNALPAVIPT